MRLNFLFTALLFCAACLLATGCESSTSANIDGPLTVAQSGAPTHEDLGTAYLLGQGVQQNDTQAFYWFQKAADAGIASAKYNMGLIYSEGLGIAPDQAKAQTYFREAAQLGFRPAKKRI